jgi:hypothetical protein
MFVKVKFYMTYELELFITIAERQMLVGLWLPRALWWFNIMKCWKGEMEKMMD